MSMVLCLVVLALAGWIYRVKQARPNLRRVSFRLMLWTMGFQVGYNVFRELLLADVGCLSHDIRQVGCERGLQSADCDFRDGPRCPCRMLHAFDPFLPDAVHVSVPLCAMIQCAHGFNAQYQLPHHLHRPQPRANNMSGSESYPARPGKMVHCRLPLLWARIAHNTGSVGAFWAGSHIWQLVCPAIIPLDNLKIDTDHSAIYL